MHITKEPIITAPIVYHIGYIPSPIFSSVGRPNLLFQSLLFDLETSVVVMIAYDLV